MTSANEDLRQFQAHDARVTTTMTWHGWADERPYDVTVTVPASWAKEVQHEWERPGPLVLAEALYDLNNGLVTPQECCDFMDAPGHNGMQRIKRLVAWRKAQLRAVGSFDWEDYTTAFAVGP